MKKTILVMAIALFAVSFAQAQQFNPTTLGSKQTDVYSITSYKPFAATDSTSQRLTTGTFPLAPYDTIYAWAYNTSLYNKPNVGIGLEGSFDNTNWYDSLGIVCDTTNSKLQVLKFIGAIPTNGITSGRLRISGFTNAGPTTNSKSTVINIWLVCHKRLNEQQGKQP